MRDMLNRIVFYVLLLALNVWSFILIGISFLVGSSLEGSQRLTAQQLMFRHVAYGITVSLLFALLILLLGYLFRVKIPWLNNRLFKLFVFEFIIFFGAFIITYSYLYGN